MDWKRVDWECLRRLRDGFLRGERSDYWLSEKELLHYDLAFAPRIAAKWRAVFSEILPAGFLPNPALILDWGCGTGIASRTLREFVDADALDAVWFWDRSETARTFAAERMVVSGVEAVCPENAEIPRKPFYLLVSHVANELTAQGRAELDRAIEASLGFVWVEPGTPEASATLIAARERLLAKGFLVQAPCPHQGPCGLKAPGREKDWCHHFAEPDADFFQTAHWARFAKEMQIDLRSLPVSYLAARKGEVKPGGAARVLGRPRVLKGHAKLLVCREAGVGEETARPTPGLRLKDLRETVFARWWK